MTDPTAPGPDEVRVRQLLVKNGVGPDADPGVPLPPKPTGRPRDWLDDILDTPAQEKQQVTKPSRPAKQKPDDEPAEPDSKDTDEETQKKPPSWDPVAIADRIVHAYQQRPAGERLRHAADIVVHSRARIGQLVYTASGVWVAWRVGLTPWLLHFTADAPVGIPVAVLGLGWLINRRFDPGPLLIAWIGRAIYTATVINLVLHP